ncbi:caspase-1-like isoform X1 [Xiphophorus couchianus]|uniref:caspase-1-like isoform X1 n=1 Tax=Xiphophorus couchianus TaxID=32473 RepID=UPI0010165967|nr:caspase-1-like isoform X1 [Xiphophorus couchianus]
MAPKKPKKVLANILENLSERNFKKFCSELLDRDKRVKRSQVERKDFLEVAEVIIEKYADEALKVAEELLQQIDCEQAAHDLAEEAKEAGLYWADDSPTGGRREGRLDGGRQEPVATVKDFWMSKKGDPEVYPVTEDNYRNRVALMITNIKFSDEKLNRDGAEKDEENMEKLLKSLGYEVVKHRNLTGKGIDDALKSFAKLDKLKRTDSVFVVIMSHGKLGKILGIDYKEDNQDDFAVDKIFKCLNSHGCQALINKPKVVILQACRGGRSGVTTWVHDGESTGPPAPPPEDQEPNLDQSVHVEKDFVSLLASTPDNKAFRESKNGSILIQNIMEVFTPESYQKHIIDLFTKVQDLVSKCGDDKKKQMPVIDRMTLNKQFFLYPGLLDSSH